MKYPERYRVKGGRFATKEGEDGMFLVNLKKVSLEEPPPSALVLPDHIKRAPFKSEKRVGFVVIASSGEGWNHISVTCPEEKRCPTWEEMSFINDMFFEPEETTYQIHPPACQHVNNHPYCLHIWQKHDFEMPLPPTELIDFIDDEKKENE